jgi:uncharacterized membrane protein YfcA
MGFRILSVELVGFLAIALFAIAILFSSIGHGGASGYIAIFAIIGLEPELIRPIALILNVVVAGFGTYKFAKAGYINWRTAAILIGISAPLSFLGGTIHLPAEIYRPILGVLLLLSALYLIWKNLYEPKILSSDTLKVPLIGSLPVGGAIGFLSGLTGIGGGVLLSPVLILFNWANVRQTAGLAVCFVLANSIAGLAGNLVTMNNLPAFAGVWALAVLLGALIGTKLGLKIAPIPILVWLLAMVVLIAALKFLIL